jgi:hypothetical protein
MNYLKLTRYLLIAASILLLFFVFYATVHSYFHGSLLTSGTRGVKIVECLLKFIGFAFTATVLVTMIVEIVWAIRSRGDLPKDRIAKCIVLILFLSMFGVYLVYWFFMKPYYKNNQPSIAVNGNSKL